MGTLKPQTLACCGQVAGIANHNISCAQKRSLLPAIGNRFAALTASREDFISRPRSGGAEAMWGRVAKW